jgi:hypothetical protein
MTTNDPTTPPLPYAAPNITTATPSQDLIPPDWTNVETFPLDPFRFTRYAIILVLIHLSMWLLTFAVVVTISILFTPNETWAERLISLSCMIVCLGIWSAVSTVLTVIKARRSWRVCQLILSEQGLLLTQLKGPPKRINRADVVRIVDTFDAFRVHLPLSRALVSKRFINPDRIRERLAAWQPIQQGAGLVGLSLSLTYSFGSAAILLAAVFIGIYTTNFTTLLACTLLALALALVQCFFVFRERTHARSTKIFAAVNLLAPLFLLLRLATFR